MSTTTDVKTCTAASSSETQKLQPVTDRGYSLGSQGIHNLAFGGILPKNQRPRFSDKLKERRHVLEHMAGTFRVFGRRGFNEGPAGHISVRDPVDPETFWINPLGLHFSQIDVSSLVHVNSEGEILSDGNQAAINAAGFRIHAQLHKSRPDINAACHAHTVYGKAWAAFGKELEMINQDACIFYKNHSVYQDFGGVVLDSEEGKRLAESLGSNKAVLLQNHGLLTVGETIDEAGYLFTLLERTCEVQLQVEMASRAGLQRNIIGDDEAYYTYYNTSDPESLYSSFQSDYNYELKLTNGEFLQ
ncbi:LANO_0A02894g1_1 [Lachancea nothofagi CBS 11611]|uniref:LANO_0A02894g1_1 n=1 Tax=Lachancea nothofagi CBS 11611 TaxID=1266666 RepID=A0A1G4INY3_9SACH|nr:LANO_0A02894g1_1 [Lachancea nothofagi CBS 11611]